MLSISTLWLVFTVNYLSADLVWAYVMRRYPKLAAARYWSAGSLLAAAPRSDCCAAWSRRSCRCWLPR